MNPGGRTLMVGLEGDDRGERNESPSLIEGVDSCSAVLR